jgi:hypothetical protein
VEVKKNLTKLIIALTIISMIATAQAQAPFTPPEIIVYTERQAYRHGDTVAILGVVVDSDFNPVPNITVSVIIFNPENTIALDIEATTNQSGIFTAAYNIRADAPEGEYLITAQDLEGEFTPGIRSFIVCSICPTEPQVVIVTTTLPGPTITTTSTTTALTFTTTTATVQTTVTAAETSQNDLLTIVFIILVAALFVVIIIALRKYG